MHFQLSPRLDIPKRKLICMNHAYSVLIPINLPVYFMLMLCVCKPLYAWFMHIRVIWTQQPQKLSQKKQNTNIQNWMINHLRPVCACVCACMCASATSFKKKKMLSHHQLKKKKMFSHHHSIHSGLKIKTGFLLHFWYQIQIPDWDVWEIFFTTRKKICKQNDKNFIITIK